VIWLMSGHNPLTDDQRQVFVLIMFDMTAAQWDKLAASERVSGTARDVANN
jgi:hypothetical protein